MRKNFAKLPLRQEGIKMGKGTILVTPRGYAKYGDEANKQLESLGYEMNVNRSGKPVPREDFIRQAKEATGIIVGVDELDASLLKECKQLKAVVKFGVGTDNIDLAAAKDCGIKVGRCVGSNSNAVAEFTMGLMFAAAKWIVSTNVDVRNNGWGKPTGYELFGKTIGIIGFGNIGKHVARMAKGIGMHVLAYDVFELPKDALSNYDARQTSVEDILKNSDFISIHTPLTDQTKDMITTSQFEMMKSTAILVNAARGGIVNEKALYNALKNKTIFAAASDVFTTEPPEQEEWVQDFIHLDNFILTSHIASRSVEAEQHTVRIATEEIIKLLEG